MKYLPKIVVIAGYGLNCEEETQFAFNLAGGSTDIIHINDLISNRKLIQRYQIMAIPGGFSYGDDTGSGNAFAYKLRNHLWDELVNFVSHDNLVIGICNGCQVLVNLGLLPGFDSIYGKRDIALLANDSVRYTVRWTDLKICNNTPWLTGIKTLTLPIAHGEGKFYAESDVLEKLKGNGMIAMRYVKGEIWQYSGLSVNPTGTVDNIAAITDSSKRILGIMPHPERAIFFHQLPNWPLLKEKYLRTQKNIPKFGPGLEIFKNAISYFKDLQ
jgi:phosphoribosylformylglycinamidine synthase subunit PurQ / glutaminase